MNSEEPRKFDHTKPQIDLIPSEALIELGKVLAYGAKKYSRGNWSKGLSYSRIYSAAMRHMLAWNGGEDSDPETGLSHLAHAMCNLTFLLWYDKHRPDLDDRWHKEVLNGTHQGTPEASGNDGGPEPQSQRCIDNGLPWAGG